MVVQSMRYRDDVELEQWGVKRSPIVSEAALLRSPDREEVAPESNLRLVLKDVNPGPVPVVLDVERWPLDIADPEQRARNLQRLKELLSRARRVRPDLRFGLYSVVPSRVYWPIVDPKRKSELLSWKNANMRTAADLSPDVDAVFPSLYTFYNDRKGWVSYANSMLEEARKLQKPVYCVLWPQYHDSNVSLRGQYLDPGFWRLELETCKQGADGIVIWNHDPLRPWDAEASWWKATVEFLRAHRLSHE